MGLSVEEVAGIYRRHADVVFRRCLAMLGSREEALDAVQEVFVKVLTRRLTFRGNSNPTTWIYRITTNHALNRLRSRRRQTDIDDIPLSLHPRTAGPEGQIISREILSILLDPLDDRSRAILFLHFFEGLDQGEVAGVLEISRRAVVKRLTRIRAALDDVLGNAGRRGGKR
jgi:RNA polymerase sigma-70 factor (ECF subfamily)